MTNENSNVIIENTKVIFSQEILDYFENLRNEKTSKWIDKYFEVLSDSSNINSEKFNIHHIKPCCTFKDETHKTRKETQKLADKFNGNRIKLSIYNHLFAHFYLWKIFNIKDLKLAFRQMYCEEKYKNNLTEVELDKIARLKEEFTKENIIKDVKEYMKNYRIKYLKENHDKIIKHDRERYKKNKYNILKKSKKYYKNNREKILNRNKLYYTKNRNKILKHAIKYYVKNREKILKQTHTRYINNRDYILKSHHDYYKNNIDKIKKREKIYREQNKEKISEQKKIYRKNNHDKISKHNKSYYKNNREKILARQKEYENNNRDKIAERKKRYDNQQCYDPKKEEFCTLCALKSRIRKFPDLYIGVNPKECVVKRTI